MTGRFPRHENHLTAEGFDDRVCLALDCENIGLGLHLWLAALARCIVQGTTPVPSAGIVPGMELVYPKGERATVTRAFETAYGDHQYEARMVDGCVIRGRGPKTSYVTVAHRAAGVTGEVVRRTRKAKPAWMAANKSGVFLMGKLEPGAIVLPMGSTDEHIVGVVVRLENWVGGFGYWRVLWLSDRRGAFSALEWPGDLVVPAVPDQDNSADLTAVGRTTVVGRAMAALLEAIV